MDINDLMKLTDEDKRQALNMGLLQGGLGILANNTGNYGAFGPAFGRGAQQGLLAYQDELHRAPKQRMQQHLLKSKVDETKREEEERKRREQAIQNFLSGSGLEGPQLAAASINPEAAARGMLNTDVGKPFVREVWNGQEAIQQEFDPITREWREIGRGPRWAPPTQTAQAPYYTAIPTEQGLMSFNNRTGRMEPVSAGGTPVVRPQDSPKLQRDLSAAKAVGTETGKRNVDKVESVGQALASGEDAIRLVDEVLQHPGFSKAVGWKSILPTFPGTDAADFESRLEQIKGKSFLEAFETLKGGGQITQIEGDKATQALNRMRLSTSQEEFATAAADFKKYVTLGMQKAATSARQAGADMSGSQGQLSDPLGIRRARQ